MPAPDNKTKLPGIYGTFLNSESALKRYLRRFFYRSEDIDDMAQETFLRAYKYTQDRDIAFPKAYLFQVAKSVAMKELTRKTRKLTDYLEEACEPDPDHDNGPELDTSAEQTLSLFCEAIAELPPQCRRVFLMRKYQAMSYREIASTLNISVSAVEQHITIGIKRCKEYTDQQEHAASPQSRAADRQGRDAK